MKTWSTRLWNERALRCMDDSEPELRKKARQTSDAINETRDIRESRMSPPATPQSSGAKCVWDISEALVDQDADEQTANDPEEHPR